MLLCGEPRERIENVCVVRGTLLNGPVLHRHRHGVCNAGVDLLALLDRCLQCLVDALGQTVFHDGVAENIGAKNLARGSLAEVPSLSVRLVVVNRRNRTGTGTCHGKFFLLWGAWQRRCKKPAGKRKPPEKKTAGGRTIAERRQLSFDQQVRRPLAQVLHTAARRRFSAAHASLPKSLAMRNLQASQGEFKSPCSDRPYRRELAGNRRALSGL